MDADYIKYLLKKKDLTKEDVKKALGWSETTYYRRFAGETEWTVQELRVLADLGFTPAELGKAFGIFF